VQHIEFFHNDHFEKNYHRRKPSKQLSRFIDFFWEIDFDKLWDQYPNGFSDALFPNIGYTYMINLGTPFVMELDKKKYPVKSDTFLPRHKHMVCHHSPGNRIFGIKFKLSPVIFEKKINFSEYRGYLFPLSYLIEPGILKKIKQNRSFDKRVELVSDHYSSIIDKNSGSLKQVEVVTAILKQCVEKNNFNRNVEDFALQFNISPRTLQRYFNSTMSLSGKQVLQILRIRKAVEHLTKDPETFHWKNYGYFDNSHFRKHLDMFLGEHKHLKAGAIYS
jgi:AraC-like DNA-binding protein